MRAHTRLRKNGDRGALTVNQHHLAAMPAPQQTAGTVILAIEGEHRFPTEMLGKEFGRAGLEHLVFGIGVRVHDAGLYAELTGDQPREQEVAGLAELGDLLPKHFDLLEYRLNGSVEISH